MQRTLLRRMFAALLIVCSLFGPFPYSPAIAADTERHAEVLLLPEPWAALVQAAPWMRDPFVRPEFARQIRALRPTILAAAQRHNRPALSGMDDCAFAETIATILYTEHVGWLEDALPFLRPLTPLYQELQIDANRAFGSDLTVWPANLRPSVAREILRGEIPLPDPYGQTIIPIRVHGSRLDAQQAADPARITAEISHPQLGVEYLAANLERGVYRAVLEDVPVSWMTLASWHNQGIVDSAAIQNNAQARYYLWRAASYRTHAAELLDCTVP